MRLAKSARCGLIDDPLHPGFTATRWVNELAVNAGMHGDNIARLCHIGRMLNRAKRNVFRAFIRITTSVGHMKFGGTP